jgi:hypothetical protein
MRNDPLYFSWLVQCGSEEDARRVRQAVEAFPVTQRTFEDTLRAFPGGVELRQANRHLVGDYFVGVDVLPGASASSFRLVFQRRPAAGRYWKDVMMKVLRMVQDGPSEVRVTLDYRGDERPSETPAGK